MTTKKALVCGFLAVILAFTLALAFTACKDDEDEDDYGPAPQSATYISGDSGGNLYTLVITENISRSARYTAKDGDSFTFTVELFNNGKYSVALTYSGTIESAEGSGTEIVIKITVNGKPLTITVKGTEMTVISGTIVLDNEEEITIAGHLTPMNTLEDLPAAKRWESDYDKSTGVTIAHSVDSEGVCKIIVGGTAQDALPAWENIWKAYAYYKYTAKAGQIYTYTFEAWTEGAGRTMTVQWYTDNAAGIYHNTGYDNTTQLAKFTITSQRKTYTITGKSPIPNSGVQELGFQCANQTGTFYVKILSITGISVVAKNITITGITVGTSNVSLSVAVENSNGYAKQVAFDQSVVSNSVSFKLRAVDDYGVTDDPWFGSGPHYLELFFHDNENVLYDYVYTGGQPYTSGDGQKYNITSATSTIPFDQFTIYVYD